MDNNSVDNYNTDINSIDNYRVDNNIDNSSIDNYSVDNYNTDNNSIDNYSEAVGGKVSCVCSTSANDRVQQLFGLKSFFFTKF